MGATEAELPGIAWRPQLMSEPDPLDPFPLKDGVRRIIYLGPPPHDRMAARTLVATLNLAALIVADPTQSKPDEHA